TPDREPRPPGHASADSQEPHPPFTRCRRRLTPLFVEKLIGYHQNTARNENRPSGRDPILIRYCTPLTGAGGALPSTRSFTWITAPPRPYAGKWPNWSTMPW